MLEPGNFGIKSIHHTCIRSKISQKLPSSPDIPADYSNSRNLSLETSRSDASPTVDVDSHHYHHQFSRSQTDLTRKAYERIQLYQSYARQSYRDDAPFEARVQGWIYQPNLNRKGKLMIAAFERLIGNPGKDSAVNDVAAAQADSVHENIVNASQTERGTSTLQSHYGTWMNLKPPLFRSKSSKSSVLTESASMPRPLTASNSRPPSPNLTIGRSQQPSDGSSSNEAELGLMLPSKPLGGSHVAESPGQTSRKGQKYVIRERLSAVSHKSLAMRDVKIILESEPDESGHSKKRTFWTYSDESGRFGQCCALSFKPVLARVISGQAMEEIQLIYIPDQGVSVISDIDDTVRHTGVTKSKRELLHNVLAKSYDDCKLDGVGEWYQAMAESGAYFHYVSNSPWQLYDVIQGFLYHHNFPEGSVHLKRYAGLLDGLTEPAKGRKRASLERIMEDFPKHKFILVGDSGEADLEAYSDIAVKFPDQVLAIYIRDITLSHEEPLTVYDRPYRHKKYHSVDITPFGSHKSSTRATAHNLGCLSSTLDHDKPPALPPRIRKSVSGVKMQNLHITVPELRATPASYLDSKSAPPESNSYYSDINIPLPSINVEVSKKSEDTTSSDTSNQPQQHRSESPSPLKPSRPKLLRRTSSKLMEGMYTMASSTSYVAQRLLSPQLPARPEPGDKPGKSKTFDSAPSIRSPKVTRNSKSIHLSEVDHAQIASNSEPRSATIRDAEPDHGWFIPSSQEFAEFDRLVDKRTDNWKLRVMKQQRLLPKSILLRMWRQPDDVKAESLKLINANK